MVRPIFSPLSLARDVMRDDPGVRGRILAKRARSVIAAEDAMARREQTESLASQGEMMRSTTYASDIWATAVTSLTPECLKFSLNAATDTLPHNSNLSKWRKGQVSENCKLCGLKQTLHHVLNNCKVSLNMRRYNHRHDQVLGVIAEMACTNLPENYQLTVDLGSDNYHFPAHIALTNLRPDLVIWSDVNKHLTIIELTVCYETGFEEAASRKMKRYSDLTSEARERGYQSLTIPVQVGSRGVLEEDGLGQLRKILKPVSDKAWKTFLMSLTRCVIEESHKIWILRNKK